ncbi:hypothetical protein GH714_026182 [Hevea brasiliensis]|uniref:mitogen-activated protein kinase kinase n=1 Tax=Hevea brasiliensis TaxID=3981 RepID=A0A6A6N3J7_HEVBR|nr:hypothetical protein GH714_026182 [Hevea brasiliensis]
MGALNGRKVDLKLSLPPSPHGVSIAEFLTESGTFVDGDLRVNRDGIRIVSQNETQAAPPIKPSDHQLALADLETVKVIGKGSSGIVQLVRHKWTEQFFALKAIQLKIEEKARKAIARELRINLTSQCPYVVKFYESFFNNGDISIVLEYMDGGSLVELLKKSKKITEPYLAAICKQPERISSEISEGSHNYKSDIWSMGIVLLECATGQFPYSPPEQDEVWANVFELMEAIVEQPEPCAPSDQFSPEFAHSYLHGKD